MLDFWESRKKMYILLEIREVKHIFAKNILKIQNFYSVFVNKTGCFVILCEMQCFLPSNPIKRG